jgi:predicted RecA/RadA family phage recombinase
MKNFIQKGNVLQYTAGADVSSGDVVVSGDYVGIAVADIANGETGSVSIEGVYELAKEASLVVAQGDKLYWATDDEEVTLDVSDTPIGTAFEASGSAATTVLVRLAGDSATAQAENVAQVTTADGTDAGTTQALANALKASLNAVLSALKDAGIMVAD